MSQEMEQKVPKTPKHRIASLRWWADYHLVQEKISHTQARRLLENAEQCRLIGAVLGKDVEWALAAGPNRGIHLSREQIQQLACIATELPVNDVRALVDELRGMKDATLKARNALVRKTFFDRLNEMNSASEEVTPDN